MPNDWFIHTTTVRRPAGGRKARPPAPLQVFDAFNSQYRALWPLAEAARRNPQHHLGIKGWAEWSYLPVNVAMGIIQSLTSPSVPMEVADEAYASTAQLFATLAGWRCNQVAYRFAPQALASALEAPPADYLPLEVFRRLPQPTVYVETPGTEWLTGMPMAGFFACLDDRGVGGNERGPELILTPIIDSRHADSRLLPSLGEAARRTGVMAVDSADGHVPNFVPVTYPLPLGRCSVGELDKSRRLGLAQELDDMGFHSDRACFLRSAEAERIAQDVLARALRLSNVLAQLCAVAELAEMESAAPVH